MIIIVDGFYGSGQTTYCKNFIKENTDFVHIEVDKILHSSKNIKTEILKIIEVSNNVIIDFYFRKRCKALLDYLIGLGAVYMFINVSIDISYKRFIKRRKKHKLPKMNKRKYKMLCYD